MSLVVRTPDPPFARPREFLHAACLDLRRSYALARQLAKRDIRNQYRQTLLGAGVVLLPPLTMTVIGLGFHRAGILSADSQAIPYGLFVLLGVILWTTFLDAIHAPIQGLLTEQRLLARMGSPPEAIILGKLGPVLFNLGVRTLLLAAAIAWYGIVVPATVVLAPLGALALIALGTAVGLLLAPLNLVYRDVSRVLFTLTAFWLFFSPVYFPAPRAGGLGTIMRLNPVTPLLSGARALALTGDVPDAVLGVSVALGALLLLAAAWLYVRVALPVAIEQTTD